MKLIRPIEITQALVTANSATNADADYVPATSYALNALVTYDRRIYKSLQAANVGNTPGITASASWWSDQGPSNKWAVFDSEVNTKTTATSPWAFTLSGVSVDSLSLIGMSASTVDIVVTKDAATVYSKTVSLLDTSLVTNWGEYFFSEPEFKSDIALVDLPAIPGAVVTVTITRTGGGEVSCGKFDCGKVLNVGLEIYGLKRSGEDYTSVTFDQFRTATIGTQRYVRKFSTTAIIENTRFDLIARRLDALASVPLVIIGGDGHYDSLIVYGLLSYSIDLSLYQYSHVSFDVKGLI